MYGAGGQSNVHDFILAVGGLGLVMASACAINNYTDREIDAQMSRTKLRPTVSGNVSGSSVLVLAGMLAVGGFTLLWLLSTHTALWIALFGYIVYLGPYGYFKRKTVHGTLVGALAGATPPVVGYTAAASELNIEAFILFLILIMWQMPHFYAIAIRRALEYKIAKIPVLPVVQGVAATRRQMTAYGIGFGLLAASLSLLAEASYSYLVVLLAVSIWWLYAINKPIIPTNNSATWAKTVFKRSLVVLMVFSLMISLDSILP